MQLFCNINLYNVGMHCTCDISHPRQTGSISITNLMAIFKTGNREPGNGNGELENGNGESGNGNGESLKWGIFKMGNL